MNRALLLLPVIFSSSLFAQNLSSPPPSPSNQDLQRIISVQQAQIEALSKKLDGAVMKNFRSANKLVANSWYRVATISAHSYGSYLLSSSTSGRHNSLEVKVSRTFENGRMEVGNHTWHIGYGWGISKLRLLKKGMYDPWYLEVYVDNFTVSHGEFLYSDFSEITNRGGNTLEPYTPSPGSPENGYIASEYSIAGVSDLKGGI